jgi:apolipoprotein N-acyltransferase
MKPGSGAKSRLPGPRLIVGRQAATGAQLLALAAVAGALAACGFQPLGLWPLALAGFAGLLALVARARGPAMAMACGWAWGVGHFTLGNNWIATAFTYQAKMPAALGGIAVFLLALYLALFPAGAALAGWLIGRRRPLALVLAMAGSWTVWEWLRGWVFTGFPWNPLAAVALGTFARPGLAAVVLPWTGTYGMSGLVALLAGCWWLAAGGGRRNAVRLALAIVPLVLIGGAELWRPVAEPGRVAMTLVQPNIEQTAIDDPGRFGEQFATLARLSSPGNGGRRLVLWPESGVPDYLRDGYPFAWYGYATYLADPAAARARIARVIGPDSLLLTGSVDLVLAGNDAIGGRNVITALDGQGRIVGSYAKAHLVPYGEYLPLRDLLEPLGLARLVPGAIDFLPGPGPRTADFGPLGRMGGQICYEIVFSGEVADRTSRPDYIFNPTNDGWFGSWGPPQHLAQARMRAIEEGLPVLRSTTNGISAVIDARGVVRASIARGVAGRIDMPIPAARAPTLFAGLGNRLGLIWAAVLLVSSLVAKRHRLA